MCASTSMRRFEQPHSVPSLQVGARFNLDRYQSMPGGAPITCVCKPKRDIESALRGSLSNENSRKDDSAGVENREPFDGTYETEDAETDGTVTHRKESREPKQNQNCLTVTVTRNTLSRSEPHYIPISELPGMRGNTLGPILGTDADRAISAEARPADGRDLRRRGSPLSSPPSVIRLQGLPRAGSWEPTGFRGDHSRAKSCNRGLAHAEKTLPYHCVYTKVGRAMSARRTLFTVSHTSYESP